MKKYKVKPSDVEFEHSDGSVSGLGAVGITDYINKNKGKKIKNVYVKKGITTFVLDD